MSARGVLQSAVVAALREAGLAAFDAPPVRGAMPYAVVGEVLLRDAGAVGLTGRSGSLLVTFQDGGERPARLREMMEAGEAAVEALGPVLGEGWRLTGVLLARSRIARAQDRWLGSSEFAVRMWREDG